MREPEFSDPPGHPRRLIAEWASGTIQALNPLVFTTSAGITAGLGIAAARLTHAGHLSAADVALRQIDPYLQYFLLGLLCHAFLVLLGARQPWYLTPGVSLFSGGGPAAAASVLTTLLTVAATFGAQTSGALTRAVNAVAVAGIVAANAFFFVGFALGQPMSGGRTSDHYRGPLGPSTNGVERTPRPLTNAYKSRS